MATWLWHAQKQLLLLLVCSGAYGANEDLGIQDFRGSNSILLPIQAMPNL